MGVKQRTVNLQQHRALLQRKTGTGGIRNILLGKTIIFAKYQIIFGKSVFGLRPKTNKKVLVTFFARDFSSALLLHSQNQIQLQN